MSTDDQIVKTLTGHRVLTCFANVERFNSNFNTTSANYDFQWLKKVGKGRKPLFVSGIRRNSKNEIIEIIEYMSEPQPGIVLTLNEIEVFLYFHKIKC